MNSYVKDVIYGKHRTERSVPVFVLFDIIISILKGPLVVDLLKHYVY